MQAAATLAARRPSRLSRLFWGLSGAILAAILSITAWDFATGLIARAPILGYGVTALIAALLLVLLAIALRELAAFSRLARIDSLHRAARAALAEEDLAAARAVVADLTRLYASREDTRWGRDRLAAQQAEQFDASGLLGLAETELLVPLDRAATQEIETAARQVATVTALVPLAMADVVAALTANFRMIRRMAEIYGERETAYRAANRVMQTQADWGTLTRVDKGHRIIRRAPMTISHDGLTAWLIEAALRYTGKAMSVATLQSSAVLYPFTLDQPLAFVASKSPALELRADGSRSQIVAIQGLDHPLVHRC